MNSSNSIIDPTKSLPIRSFPITVLLVDDQQVIAEAVRHLLEDEKDIAFHYCNDPKKAIEMANAIHPTVILQDLVMPDVEGLVLVKYFRANPETKNVPLVVLSTKEDPKIKAEAFAAGANDYMVKVPKKEELVARVNYHSKSYILLLERNLAYEKLAESQRVLQAELTEAAEYVKSILPLPMKKQGIHTAWCFIPSTQLGGDAFGYHWLDEDHFAFYLLDVCGHGVGAALLSISVINVLRSCSLSHIDFRIPKEVLEGLNKAFPMEDHNQMFFTIWYGIYNKKKREICYSSGGHPPVFFKTGPTYEEAKSYRLSTSGIVVGGVEDADFTQDKIHVGAYNKLLIFSDGVFEIHRKDGTVCNFPDFIQYLENRNQTASPEEDIKQILKFSQQMQNSQPFVDDFSILEIIFE